MSITAFLTGLYLVPLVLLAWGHRIRRTTPRGQRAFWGAIIGHCVAGLLALSFGILTPELWPDTDAVRGFFGLWAMLLFPMLGALAGLLFTPTDR
ncbi:MAG: hypothetical protein ABI910_01525 [Gemmatimonadota bacterium]